MYEREALWLLFHIYIKSLDIWYYIDYIVSSGFLEIF